MNKKMIISIVIVVVIAIIVIASVLILGKFANSNNEKEEKEESETVSNNTDGMLGDKFIMNVIKIKIKDEVLNVKLENNSSANALLEKLKEDDITINAHDYGNFEKVGDLGFSIETNDTNITTKPGDLILYQGDKITLYYDTNTWEFTKLGEVIGKTQEELKELLGTGDVTMVLSVK